MSLTAIIAGAGALPRLLSDSMAGQGKAFLVAEMEGFPAEPPGIADLRFRVERLVPFLEHLAASGVTQVVFAGAVRRPRLEPELFDPRTATLIPQFLPALQAGDDALLRAVIAIFEDWDLPVVGAHDVAPDLVPDAGVLTGAITGSDRSDAARASGIVAALGAVDIGQGAVVAGGLCLGVEALPGTDAMLDAVALHRGPVTVRSGLLYKAPKPGQDRRADLPVIGPVTISAAARAGLAGIAWEAGGLLLLDRAATLEAAEQAGLFLWSRAP